jgi:hypothetical protein
MRLKEVEENLLMADTPRPDPLGEWTRMLAAARRLRASGSRYMSYDPDDGLEAVLDRRI